MTNKLFRLFLASNPIEQPLPPPPPDRKWFGKKLYVAVAAIIIIAVILTAFLLAPPSNASVIKLGVHYKEGEKLIYDIAVSSTSSGEIGNSSLNLSIQGTLTVDVLKVEGDTYTLNYTTSLSSLGYSVTTSHATQVQSTDMVNLLTLLPVALQQYAPTNDTTPLATAIFSQTEAKVGDTWQIPLSTPESGSTETSNMTVTFAAIQDLSVPAGNYRVFKTDFSAATPPQTENSVLSINLELSGESYLEMNSCKQIQSTLHLSMDTSTSLSDNASFNIAITFTSTLKQDIIPN